MVSEGRINDNLRAGNVMNFELLYEHNIRVNRKEVWQIVQKQVITIFWTAVEALK